MKYEVILKVKDRSTGSFYTRWRCVKKDYHQALKDYETYYQNNKENYYDHVILINKLDDEGNFEEIIQ